MGLPGGRGFKKTVSLWRHRERERRRQRVEGASREASQPATRLRYQTGKHLEAFVLLLLAQQSDHGGALLERLTQILPRSWSIDSGQVYRLLRELEASGALVSRWLTDTGGAPVRVYEMTPGGWGRLQAWQEDIRLRRNSMNHFLRLYRQMAP